MRVLRYIISLPSDLKSYGYFKPLTDSRNQRHSCNRSNEYECCCLCSVTVPKVIITNILYRIWDKYTSRHTTEFVLHVLWNEYVFKDSRGAIWQAYLHRHGTLGVGIKLRPNIYAAHSLQARLAFRIQIVVVTWAATVLFEDRQKY